MILESKKRKFVIASTISPSICHEVMGLVAMIGKLTVHVLLKPGLENFENYFASMCDECNCLVVWTIFGIALPWDWNENWPFPVLWPVPSFPNLLAYWVQHFQSTIFWIWNSSTGIPSPPLALFIVLLPKAPWRHIPGYLALVSDHTVVVIIWVTSCL